MRLWSQQADTGHHVSWLDHLQSAGGGSLFSDMMPVKNIAYVG